MQTIIDFFFFFFNFLSELKTDVITKSVVHPDNNAVHRHKAFNPEKLDNFVDNIKTKDMIKKLLLLSAAFLTGFANGQNLISEGFDTYANLAGLGWTATNQSTPLGASVWAQGGGTAFTGGGQSGGATSFTLCNFNSTTGTGTISNWLISPVVSLQNGDVISFYTRTGGTVVQYPDRLELRIGTNGAATVLPSGGAASVGGFTTLALTVNPALTLTDYPLVWTQYSYTVSGLAGPTNSRIAFRYYVTDGGPTGDNSNIIGVDTFSVDRPLSTGEFFSQSFSMYPNPASNELNVMSKDNTGINLIRITDLNGRVVKSMDAKGAFESQINVSELNAGMYFVDIQTDGGKATTKFLKK